MAGTSRRNLYEVLGVSRDTDPDALKKAYRQLARKFHPDVNPGDPQAEARFKEVSEAYDVLSDTKRRRNFDDFGEAALHTGFDGEAARRARDAFGDRFASGGPGSHAFGDERFTRGGLEDLFGDLFSRGGWGAGPQRGADLEAELELEFLEAVQGGERRISVTRADATGGSRTETVTVRIPPGVADGGRIRLAGKGVEGRGGPAGDLLAQIRIKPHPVFRREGRNVFLNVPVTIHEATLGAKVEIPTLAGRATLTVPEGTDSGTRLRLRGKGVPNPAGGARGDLYVTVQIVVPKDLGPEDRSRLEALAESDPTDLRRDLFS